MKRKLGPFETQLFAYVQMRKLRTLATGDLRGPLRISAKQERELLSRLSRSGMIAQVRRGLYLMPERLPLEGAERGQEPFLLSYCPRRRFIRTSARASATSFLTSESRVSWFLARISSTTARRAALSFADFLLTTAGCPPSPGASTVCQ